MQGKAGIQAERALGTGLGGLRAELKCMIRVVSDLPHIVDPRCSEIMTTRKIVRNKDPLIFDLKLATRKVRAPSAKAMVPCFKLEG